MPKLETPDDAAPQPPEGRAPRRTAAEEDIA